MAEDTPQDVLTDRTPLKDLVLASHDSPLDSATGTLSRLSLTAYDQPTFTNSSSEPKPGQRNQVVPARV